MPLDKPRPLNVLDFTSLKTRRMPIRNTMIADWIRCPRYVMWRHSLGLVGKGLPIGSREIGTALHKSCEVLFKGEPLEHAVVAVMNWQEELLREFGSLGGTITPKMEEALQECGEMGLVMAQVLRDSFPPDPKNLSVEISYEEKVNLFLNNLDWEAEFTADKIIYMPPQHNLGIYTPGLWICDYKKVPSGADLNDGGAYHSSLWGDWQMAWYAYLLRLFLDQNPPVVLPGEGAHTTHSTPILGHIRYAIVAPSIKKKAGQSFNDLEDEGSYLREVNNWYRGIEHKGARWDADKRRADITTNPPMGRFLVPFSTKDPSPPEEMKDIAERIVSCLRRAPGTNVWPDTGRATGQCTNFGGWRRRCTYAPLCEALHKDPPQLMRLTDTWYTVEPREAQKTTVIETE